MVLVIAAAAGAWQLLPSKRPDAAPQADSADPLPVETMVLEAGDSIHRERTLTGTVVAARRSRLAFERAARIQQILVDDGDRVHSGQILAELDQRQLQRQLKELEARKGQQLAVLNELQAGPRVETIEAAKATVKSRQADVDLKKLTLDRIKDLAARRAISDQDLDEAQLAWEASTAALEAASQQLNELVTGTRAEKIEAQQATVDAIEAQLEQLQIQINDSSLKAPFNGTVTSRFVDEGEVVGPQQPVVELIESQNLEARIGVPTRLVPTINVRRHLELKTDSQTITGTLKSIVPQVDASTRTQTVVFRLPTDVEQNPADGQLIQLLLDEEIPVQNAYEVPLTALSTAARGLWSIYVLQHSDEPGVGLVQPRTVEVIHSDDRRAVIRGAIAAGERVVASGTHRVVPGQRVQWSSAESASRKD